MKDAIKRLLNNSTYSFLLCIQDTWIQLMNNLDIRVYTGHTTDITKKERTFKNQEEAIDFFLECIDY